MDPLEHFVKLAKRGKHGGASGGEKRAHALAKAILEHAPGLDSRATCGLKEFIDAAQSSYHDAVDLIEHESKQYD